ncbi:MAG TPA: hypothetical protein VE956_00385 [Nodularia sp. (in: cyanobacteria)]|nr:hypothetical protein [Nodularia sp. (in: cyanobacteria)]HYW17765.1 hypothetical protein [Nodularia sp. (in: cyanobacteria)]
MGIGDWGQRREGRGEGGGGDRTPPNRTSTAATIAYTSFRVESTANTIHTPRIPKSTPLVI